MAKKIVSVGLQLDRSDMNRIINGLESSVKHLENLNTENYNKDAIEVFKEVKKETELLKHLFEDLLIYKNFTIKGN